MWDAAGLAQARTDYAQAFLNDAAQVMRQAHGGGRNFVAVLEVKARAYPAAKGSEIEIGDRVSAVQDWTIQVPVGSDVRMTDRVRIGRRMWEIVGSDAGLTEALCVTLNVVRMDG